MHDNIIEVTFTCGSWTWKCQFEQNHNINGYWESRALLLKLLVLVEDGLVEDFLTFTHLSDKTIFSRSHYPCCDHVAGDNKINKTGMKICKYLTSLDRVSNPASFINYTFSYLD